MSLSFLPDDVKSALSNLNLNILSEIRYRRGQPIIVEYGGEYKYLNAFGVSGDNRCALIAGDPTAVVNAATDGCIYNYTEQMKNGFITVKHGIRIGIAGEYVTCNGSVQTIKNITSLNIRIPHNVVGCASFLFENLFFDGLHSTMLYSKPGFGKTTMLRDIALYISRNYAFNVLVFDERNEIAAMDGKGYGFDLGVRVDVIRCYNKISAIASAIRAMKPQVIITDELYGDDDAKAVKFAKDCDICVIASSHICDSKYLCSLPFDFFVELVGIGKNPVIYDKNFNAFGRNSPDNVDRCVSIGK